MVERQPLGNAEQPLTEKELRRQNTVEFFEKVVTVLAEIDPPSSMSKEKWIRDIQLTVDYYTSDKTKGDLAKARGISRSNAGNIINSTIRKMWSMVHSVDSSITQQYPLNTIGGGKPLTRKSRQRLNVPPSATKPRASEENSRLAEALRTETKDSALKKHLQDVNTGFLRRCSNDPNPPVLSIKNGAAKLGYHWAPRLNHFFVEALDQAAIPYKIIVKVVRKGEKKQRVAQQYVVFVAQHLERVRVAFDTYLTHHVEKIGTIFVWEEEEEPSANPGSQ